MKNSSMKIVIGIIMFGLIIAVHELGHFMAAKWCKIRVNEFAIGMGPTIFKRKKGETTYSLRLFPVGGFCAFDGEDGKMNEGDPLSSDTSSSIISDEHAFPNRPIWQQIITLAAGALMNIVLGFILVIVLTCSESQIASTTISGFAENATSTNFGLQSGDVIYRINGNRIYIDRDIVYYLSNDEDGVVEMEVLRDKEKIPLTVQFAVTPAREEQRQTISIDFFVLPLEKNFFSVMDYSVKQTVYYGRLIWISLFDLISGKYGFSDLSGPVGIVGTIGSVIDPSVAIWQNIKMLLQLSVFMTINIGFCNLLPIPALDGCRILFRIGEKITGKKINPEKEGMIHFIGLALLMLLMVAVTFNDVLKLIRRT